MFDIVFDRGAWHRAKSIIFGSPGAKFILLPRGAALLDWCKHRGDSPRNQPESPRMREL